MGARTGTGCGTPRRLDVGEGSRSPRWSRRRVGHGRDVPSGMCSPPDGPLGSSGSGALPSPPRKSSESSSSSRSRKNHTSQTISAPTSKTRSPIMKIHPSSVTSRSRLALYPVLHQPSGDREARRNSQRAASLLHRGLHLGPFEPAHVLELVVDPARLARTPGGDEPEHQRGRKRPRLGG